MCQHWCIKSQLKRADGITEACHRGQAANAISVVKIILKNSIVSIEISTIQDEIHEIPAVLRCPRDANAVIEIDQSVILIVSGLGRLVHANQKGNKSQCS